MPAAPTSQGPVNFGALNMQPQGQTFNPTPTAQPAPPQILPSTNKLTPTLTADQLKQNIDALQKQSVPNDKIQAYVNHYSKSGDSYALKNQDGSNIPSVLPTPQITPRQLPTAPPVALAQSAANAVSQYPGALNNYKNAVAQEQGAGMQQFASGIDQAQTGDVSKLLEGGLSAAAGLGRTAFAAATPAINAGMNALGIPQAVQAAGNAISNTKPLQEYGLGSVGQTQPDIPTRIATDVANASTVAGSVAGGQGGAEITPEGTLSDASSQIKDVASAANDKVASAISPYKTTSQLKSSATADINKALSNTGKASAGGVLAKDAQRLTGFENLYKLTKDQTFTRPDGSTFTFDPANNKDPISLLTAFNQTKQNIWQQVQSRLQQGQRITPNYSGAKAVLDDVVKNSADPALAAHAQSRLASIAKLETQGVQGTQRFLQETLNPRIGAALQGASDAAATKLDVQLASKLNDALDESLSKLKGSTIGPLKDQYASLKAIEPGLVSAYQKMARASGTGGLPGYINDFGNLSLVEAFASHNPAFFLVKGIGTKILSKVLESQRSSMDHIQSAFKSIANYTKPESIPTVPTLALPPGSRGTPSRTAGGLLTLPERAQSTIDSAERARLAPSNEHIEPQQGNQPNYDNHAATVPPMAEKAINDHLTSAEQTLSNLSPDQIKSNGGIPALLERTKTNIADGLEAQGFKQVADHIRNFDLKTFTDFQAFKKALLDYIKTIQPGLSMKDVTTTPEFADKVSKELHNYDTTPATVNGKPLLTNTDNEFRISQLQNKLNNGPLSSADIKEAYSLLKNKTPGLREVKQPLLQPRDRIGRYTHNK